MNLASILEGKPDDALALVSRGRPITYGELRDRVGRLRGGLAAQGIEPGDRVGILAANNPFFVEAYLAALGAGAVAVPMNPASPSAEVRNELAAIGAKMVFVGPSGRGAMAGIGRGAVPVETVIAPEGVELAGSVVLEKILGDPTPVVERSADDLAVMIFTAGTSGSPKAAMLTHGNLLSNIEQMQQHPLRALTVDDKSLGVLPMFHIFGLNVLLGLSLYAGASVVLVERFDPASALDTIKDHQVTIVAGAPTMFQAWATMPEADPGAFQSVRLVVSGAAPLSPETASAFETRYRVPIYQGYGLTEAAPTVTSSVVGGEPRPGSIGVPLPGVDVRLVDHDGEDVLHGDEGEIWVKGPNVFAGYWNDPDATAAALTSDGWLRTGDIAVVDDDGHLFIVDRAKDLIIVSGFNVYPAEVEDALLEHPGVEAVAVVGMPHPHSGETVKAFVVTRPGHSVEEDELIEFCAGRLARYKCPTKVTFVAELPLGMGGKLLRRALRS
ncbi:MAG TPA: long-chain fatty acid--CoA ligase [Acidimicrobiales bacterium]|nr:long-chain fatty acid--CoA ligase [Acidimicrobiales bacterium]